LPIPVINFADQSFFPVSEGVLKRFGMYTGAQLFMAIIEIRRLLASFVPNAKLFC
jgi:hypothetical protein